MTDIDWQARALAAEAERDEALEALAYISGALPKPREPHASRGPGWLSVPESAQEAIDWAIETVAYAMRRELESHPPEKRNRLTASLSFGEEPWSLTLARGDYEHRIEQQRDEARAERDEWRRMARDGVIGQAEADAQLSAALAEAIRERDEAKEVRDRFAEDSAANAEEALRARRERDAARAALDEREHAMHMRVRAGYDSTIADSWRAHVAREESRAKQLESQLALACAWGRDAEESLDANIAAAEERGARWMREAIATDGWQGTDEYDPDEVCAEARAKEALPCRCVAPEVCSCTPAQREAGDEIDHPRALAGVEVRDDEEV